MAEFSQPSAQLGVAEARKLRDTHHAALPSFQIQQKEEVTLKVLKKEGMSGNLHYKVVFKLLHKLHQNKNELLQLKLLLNTDI